MQKLQSLPKDTLLNSNMLEKIKFQKEFPCQIFDKKGHKLLNLNTYRNITNDKLNEFQ